MMRSSPRSPCARRVDPAASQHAARASRRRRSDPLPRRVATLARAAFSVNSGYGHSHGGRGGRRGRNARRRPIAAPRADHPVGDAASAGPRADLDLRPPQHTARLRVPAVRVGRGRSRRSLRVRAVPRRGGVSRSTRGWAHPRRGPARRRDRGARRSRRRAARVAHHASGLSLGGLAPAAPRRARSCAYVDAGGTRRDTRRRRTLGGLSARRRGARRVTVPLTATAGSPSRPPARRHRCRLRRPRAPAAHPLVRCLPRSGRRVLADAGARARLVRRGVPTLRRCRTRRRAVAPADARRARA